VFQHNKFNQDFLPHLQLLRIKEERTITKSLVSNIFTYRPKQDFPFPPPVIQKLPFLSEA